MTKSNLHFVITCALLIAASFYLKIQRHEIKVPSQYPITSIPFQLSNFRGQNDRNYDHSFFDTSADKRILRNYTRDGDDKSVLFYLGYWENQDEHKRIKLPRYTDDQWSYLQLGTKLIAVGSDSIRIKKFLNERGSRKELVYYSYVINGKITANDYYFRFLKLMNSLLYGRTNAAVMRISMPVTNQWPLEKAEAYEEEFLREILPLLLEYV
jgi:EpsI family protein